MFTPSLSKASPFFKIRDSGCHATNKNEHNYTDVNEHEGLLNITLENKLRKRNDSFIDALNFTVTEESSTRSITHTLK